jgi:hypothetical protein
VAQRVWLLTRSAIHGASRAKSAYVPIPVLSWTFAPGVGIPSADCRVGLVLPGANCFGVRSLVA